MYFRRQKNSGGTSLGRHFFRRPLAFIGHNLQQVREGQKAHTAAHAYRPLTTAPAGPPAPGVACEGWERPPGSASTCGCGRRGAQARAGWRRTRRAAGWSLACPRTRRRGALGVGRAEAAGVPSCHAPRSSTGPTALARLALPACTPARCPVPSPPTTTAACQCSLINNSKESYKFHFDGIFGPEAQQDTVFEAIARPAVAEALDGINGTVFVSSRRSSGDENAHTWELNKENSLACRTSDAASGSSALAGGPLPPGTAILRRPLAPR